MKPSWLKAWIPSKRNKGSFDWFTAGSNPFKTFFLVIVAFMIIVSSGVAL